ncbi:hypothetical protein U9M48_020250 [Paspalum notatum var. saurae]|uniref:Uncharacterized protein n=1 Tax=Paspalum notatum var. saurae TaxID=547442 RepID=A0AAQ3WSE3_PASNO
MAARGWSLPHLCSQQELGEWIRAAILSLPLPPDRKTAAGVALSAERRRAASVAQGRSEASSQAAAQLGLPLLCSLSVKAPSHMPMRGGPTPFMLTPTASSETLLTAMRPPRTQHLHPRYGRPCPQPWHTFLDPYQARRCVRPSTQRRTGEQLSSRESEPLV